MWTARKWDAERMIGALLILLGIAAGTAAYHVGPSFAGFLLGCVAFGLLCLGLAGFSMYWNTVTLDRSGPLPEPSPSPCTPPLSEDCERRVELLFDSASRNGSIESCRRLRKQLVARCERDRYGSTPICRAETEPWKTGQIQPRH